MAMYGLPGCSRDSELFEHEVSTVSALTVCFCCLASNTPVINAITCIHTEFVQQYFAEWDNQQLAICYMCHFMLKKIETFRRQVRESLDLLSDYQHTKAQNLNKPRLVNNLVTTGLVVTSSMKYSSNDDIGKISEDVTITIDEDEEPGTSKKSGKDSVDEPSERIEIASDLLQPVSVVLTKPEKTRKKRLKTHYTTKRQTNQTKLWLDRQINNRFEAKFLPEPLTATEENVFPSQPLTDKAIIVKKIGTTTIYLKKKTLNACLPTKESTGKSTSPFLIKKSMKAKTNVLPTKMPALTLAKIRNNSNIIKGNAIQSIKGNTRQSMQNNAIQSIKGNTRQSMQDNAIQSIKGKTRQSMQDNAIQSIKGKTRQSMQDNAIQSIKGKTRQSMQDNAIQSIKGKTRQSMQDIAIQSIKGKTRQSMQDNAIQSIKGKTRQSMQDNAIQSIKGKTRQSMQDIAIQSIKGNTRQSIKINKKKRKRRKSNRCIHTNIQETRVEIFSMKETIYDTLDKKYDGIIKIRYISQDELMREREAKKQDKFYLKQPYKCESCIQGFPEEVKYINHILKCHPLNRTDYKFHCKICDTAIKTTKGVQRHLRRHLMRYVCVSCGNEAKYLDKLEAHYKVTHQKKGIKCKDCKKTFTTKQKMGMHRRQEHMRECKYCQKAFLKLTDLNCHYRRTHPDETPYECDLCTDKFKQSHDLGSHKVKVHNIRLGRWQSLNDKTDNGNPNDDNEQEFEKTENNIGIDDNEQESEKTENVETFIEIKMENEETEVYDMVNNGHNFDGSVKNEQNIFELVNNNEHNVVEMSEPEILQLVKNEQNVVETENNEPNVENSVNNKPQDDIMGENNLNNMDQDIEYNVLDGKEDQDCIIGL